MTAATGFEIPGAASVAYGAMARVMPSDIQAVQAMAEGVFVQSGGAVTGRAGSLSVDIAACTFCVNGVSYTINASSNVSLGSADATNPKWVIIEAGTDGTFHVTAGTAAASPITPDTTANRVMLAAVYVPANAAATEAWQGTADGKGQIISKRMLRAAGTIDIQVYSAAGASTYNVPGGAREIEVVCVGGGSGGGSGRIDAAGTLRGGGGGGQGACRSHKVFRAVDLTSAVTVTVGAGGAGGAASGTAAADGATGAAGGATTFGGYLKASGGLDTGKGGTTAAGGGNSFVSTPVAATAGGTPGLLGSAGGNGTTAATAGNTGGVNSAGNGSPFQYVNLENPGSGGGGGGIPVGNGEQVGAAGGHAPVSADPGSTTGGSAGAVHANGGNASAPTGGVRSGAGGGGGGSSATNSVNGGDGGNGIYGGGGGGGGAATTGGTAKSGKGGNGGDGFCIVIARA